MIMQQLLDTAAQLATLKTDHTVPVFNVEFADRDILFPDQPVGGRQMRYTLDDGSIDQLRGLLAKSVWGPGSSKTIPKDYIHAMPDDLRADVFNRHVSDYPWDSRAARNWLVRTITRSHRTADEGVYYTSEHARAVLTDRYAVVDNLPLLEMLRGTAREGGLDDLKLVRSGVNENTLTMKAVYRERRDQDDSDYGVGIFLSNDETGRGGIVLGALVQRNSCANSIIVTDKQRWVHRGSSSTLLTQIQAAMGDALRLGFEAFNKLMQARREQLPNIGTVISALADEYGWDSAVQTMVGVGTESQPTRFGLVNGITYAAHQSFADDDEAMVEMEQLGGRVLMDDDYYGNLFRRARRLEPVARL